jgi:hypothetical protein
VKLTAAQFVIPYRTRGKNDANDAEAISEAVGRPNMRFVAIKTRGAAVGADGASSENAGGGKPHGAGEPDPGAVGEFGLVVPKGVARLRRELPGILEDAENGLPDPEASGAGSAEIAYRRHRRGAHRRCRRQPPTTKFTMRPRT